MCTVSAFAPASGELPGLASGGLPGLASGGLPGLLSGGLPGLAFGGLPGLVCLGGVLPASDELLTLDT